jgi:CheY-like chemotaxis protein
VAVAANGAEAVQRAADFRPDVLVIDWLLSDRVDGFELVRSLRASGLAAPAIVISGYPSSRNGAPTNGLTGVRFLTKPFPPKVLLEAIEAAAAEGRV